MSVGMFICPHKVLCSVQMLLFSGDPGLQWHLVAAMLFTSLPDVTVWKGCTGSAWRQAVPVPGHIVYCVDY